MIRLWISTEMQNTGGGGGGEGREESLKAKIICIFLEHKHAV